MTLNLNARAALKYGLIWEFFAVPDSVSTRPFIIPPPLKTEFSSTPITQSPERKGTVDEDVFLDLYSEKTCPPLNAKSFLDLTSTVMIQYDTIEKKDDRFITPWGRRGIDYPALIMPHPGENSNILLFRVNSYFNFLFS
mgnify:FL=1